MHFHVPGPISHAVHHMVHDGHKLVNDIKNGADTIGGEAEKLGGDALKEYNALKHKISELEDHLRRSKLLADVLHTAVQDSEKAGEEFANRVKAAADDVYGHLHSFFEKIHHLVESIGAKGSLFKDLWALLVKFMAGVISALETFAKKIGPDEIGTWVELERFKRLWTIVHGEWEHLLSLSHLLPQLMQHSLEGEKTIQRWLKPTAEFQAKGDISKDHFLQSVSGLTTELGHFMKATEFPGAGNDLNKIKMDLGTALNIMPEGLWKDVYSSLRFDKVLNFCDHATATLQRANTGLAKGATPKEGDISEHDLRLLVVSARGIKFWAKSNLDVFSIDGNFDLIDFLKTKFGGGDASGAAEAGVGGGGGGGLDVRFKAFSGAGLFFGAIALVVDILVAALTIYLDIRNLQSN